MKLAVIVYGTKRYLTVSSLVISKALFRITFSNGREISEDIDASTRQNMDLSMYLSPFNIEVEINGNMVDRISGVAESQCVEIFYSGYSHSVT